MNKHYEEAAKAKAQLATEESANEQYMGEQGMTDEVMQFSALNRIAEATLALAYEQRTANLIAIMAPTNLDGASAEQVQALSKLAHQIEERLGLA